MRLILASQSPARLHALQRAGLSPEVIVSGVDEDAVTASSPGELATTLARLKAEAVLPQVPAATGGDWVLVGCDTLLELDGREFGKPGSAETAVAFWHAMRGRTGHLHTGHHVIVSRSGALHSRTRLATTLVHFADLDDDEIAAYTATGEPDQAAGAFKIDGLGGPFVSGIEGDPHTVVGISLPLLREIVRELGVPWQHLWAGAVSRAASTPTR